MTKLVSYILLIFSLTVQAGAKMNVDFTQRINDLIIVTDSTERAQGLSNASISFQNSQNNKSHFFYVYLEPQPNGAAFGGFKVKKAFDLSDYSQVTITLKKLVDKTVYSQLVITTKDSDDKGFTYKNDFILNHNEFTNIVLLLERFEPTRRGEPYPNAPAIDLKNITSIGIRVIGRAEPDFKQRGVFAMQLEAISFQ